MCEDCRELAKKVLALEQRIDQLHEAVADTIYVLRKIQEG